MKLSCRIPRHAEQVPSNGVAGATIACREIQSVLPTHLLHTFGADMSHGFNLVRTDFTHDMIPLDSVGMSSALENEVGTK